MYKDRAGLNQRIQNFIKKVRKDAKKSISEASDLLNISEELLIKYENGEVSPPCYFLGDLIVKFKASPEALLNFHL